MLLYDALLLVKSAGRPGVVATSADFTCSLLINPYRQALTSLLLEKSAVLQAAFSRTAEEESRVSPGAVSSREKHFLLEWREREKKGAVYPAI